MLVISYVFRVFDDGSTIVFVVMPEIGRERFAVAFALMDRGRWFSYVCICGCAV